MLPVQQERRIREVICDGLQMRLLLESYYRQGDIYDPSVFGHFEQVSSDAG